MCATLLHESQNTGLALHYMSKLTRFRYFTIPHGGTKKTSPLGLVFFIRCSQRHVINACVVCNCNRCVSPMSYCTLCVRNFVARTLASRQKNKRNRCAAPLCRQRVVPFENLQVQGGYRLPTAFVFQCAYAITRPDIAYMDPSFLFR